VRNGGRSTRFRTEVRIHDEVRFQADKSNEINVFSLAPRHGFEPRFTAPKAAVLPLDDRGMRQHSSTFSLASSARLPQRAALQRFARTLI
jgi:hypothetical protein